MGTTTMGVKLDDATRERIKSAATRIDRTPHWLIKQAIFSYLEQLENSDTLPELPALLSGAANESDEAPTPAEEPHQPFLDFAEQILPQSVSRAAITADEIAAEAEFFSFGTNDLTQMTFGFSRDDAGKFLASYYDRKIYESDPFSRLDQVGVGRLVKMACELGRQTRPEIKLGICGEQGGDPSTVEFCHDVGLTYVSCSPFRVPIARLAAAQAAIKNPRKK